MLTAASASAQQTYCAFTVNSSCTGGATLSLFNGANVSGGSLNFNGINQYAEFNQRVVPTSGSLTVAFWVRVAAPLPATFTEFVSQGVSGGPGFYVGTTPTGTIRFTDAFPASGVAYPNDQAWHHLAFLTDGVGFSRGYVDGVLRATAAFGVASGAGGSNTRLGRQFDPFTEFLNGQMNDFSVYNSVLTSDEIRTLAATRSSVVPEPASVALFGFGLIALLFARAHVSRNARTPRD